MTVAPPPPKCCLVIACECEVSIVFDSGREIRSICGQWMVITRGEELPFCPACRKQKKNWRHVTQPEIDARDRAFLKAIERLGFLGPDSRLGATENT